MVKEFSGKSPEIDESAFIAENSTIVGDVKIDAGASVWYGAVLRGDMGSISVGKNSNVQDNAVVHVSPGNPAVIGSGVTVGHGAIVHGAVIGDNVLVGMGAIVLDGAKIGNGCTIAAGAVVTSKKEIPANSLVMGIPAEVVREVSLSQKAGNKMNATAYAAIAKKYKKRDYKE